MPLPEPTAETPKFTFAPFSEKNVAHRDILSDFVFSFRSALTLVADLGNVFLVPGLPHSRPPLNLTQDSKLFELNLTIWRPKLPNFAPFPEEMSLIGIF